MSHSHGISTSKINFPRILFFGAEAKRHMHRKQALRRTTQSRIRNRSLEVCFFVLKLICSMHSNADLGRHSGPEVSEYFRGGIRSVGGNLWVDSGRVT